jgi:hypothetical protein
VLLVLRGEKEEEEEDDEKETREGRVRLWADEHLRSLTHRLTQIVSVDQHQDAHFIIPGFSYT